MTEQINENRANVIACSFQNDTIADIGGSDVLFKCIVECYGQHRLLVLSPDMIWLVIVQTLTKHIDSNAGKYRDKIVSHKGKMDLVVRSSDDLFSLNVDWTAILDDFYNKIEEIRRQSPELPRLL